MLRLSIAALAVLLTLVGCNDGGFQGTPTLPEPPVPNPEPQVHTVRVLDNSFDPENLQINPGDSVRWVLRGDAGHWVTEPEIHAFRTFLEKRGDAFTYRFADATSGYDVYYHCDDHAEARMRGCIRVGQLSHPFCL